MDMVTVTVTVTVMVMVASVMVVTVESVIAPNEGTHLLLNIWSSFFLCVLFFGLEILVRYGTSSL